MHKRRILATVTAMLLACGTVFVFAEEKGAPPAQPGAEPKAPPKGADPKAKNGGPDKAAPPKEKGAEPKAPQPKDKAAEPKEPKAPQPKDKAAEPKEPKDKAPPAKDKAAEPKDKAPSPKADKPTDKGAPKITAEQRTEIRQTIIKQGDAPRVTNVDFSISIGTTVPRTVKVAVLPPRVVEIYPAWRGYRYFIVGDRIIIIDEGWRIVFIIEA
jgi:hypothetical protein